MIYVLKIDCPDEKGLVHKISGVLYSHDLNMVENEEFVDTKNGHFFMRSELEGEIDPKAVQAQVAEKLPKGSKVELFKQHKKNIVILASREYHCLGDLLIRHHFGELNANILAVAGNHKELEEFTRKFDVPFYHVPAEGRNREDHESDVLAALNQYSPQYLVLAKYMRVLSPQFVSEFPMKIINIHHSFLPAFVGSKPYHQAFERGVKMIGATSHFVTAELDDGPIINQDVVQASHAMGPSDMVRAGREVEKQVLARSLKLVFDDRVFIAGKRTVVL